MSEFTVDPNKASDVVWKEAIAANAANPTTREKLLQRDIENGVNDPEFQSAGRLWNNTLATTKKSITERATFTKDTVGGFSSGGHFMLPETFAKKIAGAKTAGELTVAVNEWHAEARASVAAARTSLLSMVTPGTEEYEKATATANQMSENLENGYKAMIALADEASFMEKLVGDIRGKEGAVLNFVQKSAVSHVEQAGQSFGRNSLKSIVQQTERDVGGFKSEMPETSKHLNLAKNANNLAAATEEWHQAAKKSLENERNRQLETITKTAQGQTPNVPVDTAAVAKLRDSVTADFKTKLQDVELAYQRMKAVVQEVRASENVVKNLRSEKGIFSGFN